MGRCDAFHEFEVRARDDDSCFHNALFTCREKNTRRVVRPSRLKRQTL